MYNGLYKSPGIRLTEIDQSFVDDIRPDIVHKQVLFIQSDWGPEYQDINGLRDFIFNFKTPDVLMDQTNNLPVDRMSFEQAYKLSSRVPMRIYRLNVGGYEDYQSVQISINELNYNPIVQKYTGEYGNYLKILQYNTQDGNKRIDIYQEVNSSVFLETHVQETLEGLMDNVNYNSNYIKINDEIMINGVWDVLVSDSEEPSNNEEVETVDDYTSYGVYLTGGQNGERTDPTSYINETHLQNKNMIRFTFLVSQQQLTSSEINSFSKLQNQRKDFVVLGEFTPLDTNIFESTYQVSQGETQPSVGWKNWCKQVVNEIEVTPNPAIASYSSQVNSGISGSYISIYHPYTYSTTSNGTIQQFPPSYSVMERYQDLLLGNGEIWSQQQGMNRGYITQEPVYILSENEKDKLYLNYINPIQKFSGLGSYVWGNKTHYMVNSQLNRLNQRMTAISLYYNLEEGMRYYLFEPMIDTTFNQISNKVDSILSSMKQRNAIYDYRYELDIRPEYIDHNYLPIKIQFAPTKTLEFIEIRYIVRNYSSTLEV